MRKLTQISHVDGQEKNVSSQVVGQSYQHESAIKQVTGSADFLDDYPTPKGCLHGAIIGAAIAKGQIKSIDLNAVKAMPGVVKVYSYDDIPGERDIGPIFKGDPLLSDGEIKYHQQPIALVIARSHHQAVCAAKVAEIDYHIDTQPTLGKLDDEAQPHVLPTNHMGVSVSDEQLAQSDLVISGQQQVGGQEHFYLEGQISLAEPTEDGGIFLRTSSQHPTEVQTLVAEVLNLPFN
jgi:xanthine dehydrogenase large subunit